MNRWIRTIEPVARNCFSHCEYVTSDPIDIGRLVEAANATVTMVTV